MHHPRLGWLHRSWATHWASMGTSATQWHHHSTFLNKNRCFGESDYNFVCLCKHCQHCHVFLKAELGVSKTWTTSTPKTASTQRFLTLLFCHFSHCVTAGQPSSGVGEHHEELRSQPPWEPIGWSTRACGSSICQHCSTQVWVCMWFPLGPCRISLLLCKCRQRDSHPRPCPWCRSLDPLPCKPNLLLKAKSRSLQDWPTHPDEIASLEWES